MGLDRILRHCVRSKMPPYVWGIRLPNFRSRPEEGVTKKAKNRVGGIAGAIGDDFENQSEVVAASGSKNRSGLLR